jgi:SAM-dependent methyltransferase
MKETMHLYEHLTDWWPLLSPPEEYRIEASVYAEILRKHCSTAAESLLKLGSGGGSNAFMLKRFFSHVTLTDISSHMLEVSRRINPDCEHVQGDMRNLRLGRTYDCVLIHDAICHMNTREKLIQAIRTAYIHTKPGGSALFLAEYFRESFTPSTEHGGYDDPASGRSLRYVEKTFRDRLRSDICHVHITYTLKKGDQVSQAHDHWIYGLFSESCWIEIIQSVGFTCFRHEMHLDEEKSKSYVLFAGERH